MRVAMRSWVWGHRLITCTSMTYGVSVGIKQVNNLFIVELREEREGRNRGRSRKRTEGGGEKR